MSYVLLLSISLVLSSCALSPPNIIRCSIINKDVAQCNPSDGSPSYDRPINMMRGYSCLSADDLAKSKSYLKKLINEL